MAKKRSPGRSADQGEKKKGGARKGDPVPAERPASSPPAAGKGLGKVAGPPPGSGMDEISAHLDRGWDLLQRSDFKGAQLSAEHVLELDDKAPEAYTLLGAICTAQGLPSEALAHYERAMEIDPGFIDPLLYAAETHMWPLMEYEQAVRLCEQALDLAEEEDEYLDALLLKAEAEISLGDEEAARATMTDLPPVEMPEPIYHLRAGRTLLDLGEVDGAERHYRKALERDATLTDAVYGLGLCAEERGELQATVRHFLKVREMDLREPPVPWGVSPERFEELCSQALAELPERIRALLVNVPVVASDYPAQELVEEGSDPRMLGYFSGVPYPEKTTVGGVPHLDTIFMYHRNIERVTRTADEVELEIRKTLVHEAGHFFGLSEEDLDEMGLA